MLVFHLYLIGPRSDARGPVYLDFNLTKGFNIMRTNQEKVYDLTKEMCNNNRAIGNLTTKIKGIKDTIKAHAERNAAIVDELAVHTEDDNLKHPDTY